MPAVSTCRYHRVHSPENFDNCPGCERDFLIRDRDSWRRIAEQLQVEGGSINRAVMCGDLLRGGKRFSARGVEEWTDYPRYRVVAIHRDSTIMFLETLDPKGEIIGHEKMELSSDQWQYWNT